MRWCAAVTWCLYVWSLTTLVKCWLTCCPLRMNTAPCLCPWQQECPWQPWKRCVSFPCVLLFLCAAVWKSITASQAAGDELPVVFVQSSHVDPLLFWSTDAEQCGGEPSCGALHAQHSLCRGTGVLLWVPCACCLIHHFVFSFLYSLPLSRSIWKGMVQVWCCECLVLAALLTMFILSLAPFPHFYFLGKEHCHAYPAMINTITTCFHEHLLLMYVYCWNSVSCLSRVLFSTEHGYKIVRHSWKQNIGAEARSPQDWCGWSALKL